MLANKAQKMAALSKPVIAMAKESVNQGIGSTNDRPCSQHCLVFHTFAAEEMSLRDGLTFERRLYHATFGMNDSKEGMSAFLQKREAKWGNA